VFIVISSVCEGAGIRRARGPATCGRPGEAISRTLTKGLGGGIDGTIGPSSFASQASLSRGRHASRICLPETLLRIILTD